MKLELATIPDEPAQQATWLESYLVGGDLRALASELAAVHDARPPAPDDSVRAHLGKDSYQSVMSRGLGVLPAESIRSLLRQPYYLLELQRLILLDGGRYWEMIPAADEFLAAVREVGERVDTELFAPIAEPIAEPAPAASRRPDRRVFWAIAATAAAVFLATFAATHYLVPPPRSAGVWGWAKAGGLPANLDRAAYLNRLADEAEEWLTKRPTSEAEAAEQFAQFRQGCTALLTADHPQLSPGDRTWLRAKCLDWGQDIDKQIVALKEKGDVGAALAATDDTVRRLSKALRDRATVAG